MGPVFFPLYDRVMEETEKHPLPFVLIIKEV